MLFLCLSPLIFAPPAFSGGLFKITPAKPFTRAFTITGKGESFAEIKLRTPSASWKKRGSESVVVSLSVDGKYRSDIVVYGGNETLSYASMLGNVPAGKHTLGISYAAEKSSVKDGEVFLSSMEITTVKPSDPLYLMYRYAPVIYGRAESSHSDVPLILYCVMKKKKNVTHVEYEIVFSNEDGGTGAFLFLPLLAAQYGRTTDIEWVYAFDVFSGGVVADEVFQAAGHETLPFTGIKDGSHPALSVATANNNFSQSLSSRFRFMLVPILFDDSGKPREDVMDAFPWSYRIMAEEMEAEGKLEPAASPKTAALSDARNYLYVDYHAKNRGGEPSLAFQVQTAGGSVYASDHFKHSFLSIGGSGWARTAIELPQGALCREITSFAFQGTPSVDYEIYEARAFFLDAMYRPLPLCYAWKGDVRLTKANRRYEQAVLKK